MLGLIGIIKEKVNGNRGKALSLLIAGIVVLSIAVTADLDNNQPVQEHYSLPYIGQMQMAYLNDAKNFGYSVIYKNASNDYFLWSGGDGIDVKTSTSGCNWSLESKADIASGEKPYCAFTYNNDVYIYYRTTSFHDGDMYYAKWNGAWSTGNTNILQYYETDFETSGASVKYYDGTWHLVCGYYDTAVNKGYLRWYTGTPSTWSYQTYFELPTAGVTYHYVPSLEIFNGTLVLTYKDLDDDLHWQTYDGVSWTDKGDIEADITDGCSMTKDPVSDKLVVVYVQGANLYYRELTSIVGGWGAEATLLDDTATCKYPHAAFIDNRTIVSFSNNHRGNYNIYTIAAPGYVTDAELDDTYHRIEFPDAIPNQANVNSSVFNLTNNDGRNITEIKWHFEDIGSIVCANNFKIWTNMSGSWANVSYNNTCDGTGDVELIDISAEKAGGFEWNTSETMYWKVEILDIGSVAEDLHSCDESIYYRITLA